ncbi:MAG: hypothetical protein RIC16_08395 [Rhodospirillales bacterium]
MNRTSTFVGAIASLALWSLVAAPSMHAATQPTTETGRQVRTDIRPYPESGYIRDLIERAQRALTALGLYDGPVSGVVDPLLIEAITQFLQRRGRVESTKIDEDLVARLESSVDIETLLDRLADIRKRKTQAARDQLLSNPETRQLLESAPDEEIADIGRDTTACFRKPDPKCLLDEATESAKAVATDGRRDWAFGEILVAQILSGLQDDALSTTRRIADPRLIIVALRRIAEAEAEAGRVDAALDAISLIPDDVEQTAARTTVARLLSDQGDHAAALDTAEPLLAGLRNGISAESLTDETDFRTSLVPVLANGDRRDEADRLLVDLVLEARAIDDPAERGVSYRRIATAYLSIGEPDVAIAMLDEIATESDRNTILIAAAAQLAAAQRPAQALELAGSVAGPRYRALAFIDVAERIAEFDVNAAQEILATASSVIDTIELPFARDFALSRLAIAQVAGGGPVLGRKTAASIGDATLRAETFWRLYLEQGLPVEADAEAASGDVQGGFNLAWLFSELADRMNARTDNETGPVKARNLFERALALAEAIKTPWARARLLARLAVTLERLPEP